jgi:hypothetical protein
MLSIPCLPLPPYPYLSQKSRTLSIIKGLKQTIFHNSLNEILQLSNDDPVEDLRFVTKIHEGHQVLL